jgi:hypothetical protein
MATVEIYLDKEQSVFPMICLLIFVLIPVEYIHCRLGTYQEEHTPEINERKEATRERINHQVHFILKKNKTRSFMESLVLRNRTFLIFVKTGKAGKENEENDFNQVSFIQT